MLEWSKGAIIAQACHGVTKCLVRFANDDQVKRYLSSENINQMHKIVLEVQFYFNTMYILLMLFRQVTRKIWRTCPTAWKNLELILLSG